MLWLNYTLLKNGACYVYDNFQGSAQNPGVEEVELTTAPDEHGGTHWGQQVGFLESVTSYSL